MHSTIFLSWFSFFISLTCTQLQGEAQAYAIEAKARAEAEQMARKADAWKQYQDAAMVDMVLESLPRVRHALAFCPMYISLQ